jgi:hypothetical protein
MEDGGWRMEDGKNIQHSTPNIEEPQFAERVVNHGWTRIKYRLD